MPAARHQGAQLALGTEWTLDRLKPNDLVNQSRSRLDLCRRQGRPYLTTTTTTQGAAGLLVRTGAGPAAVLRPARGGGDRDLPGRGGRQGRRHVGCRSAAAVSGRGEPGAGEYGVEDGDRQRQDDGNGHADRLADVQRAAGAGAGASFTDGSWSSPPGITVKDRLRVLLSADPGNVDCECDLVPPDLSPALRRAIVVVTNFHALCLRETREGKGASKTTKQVLDPTVTVKAFTETPAQMVSRSAGSSGRAAG